MTSRDVAKLKSKEWISARHPRTYRDKFFENLVMYAVGPIATRDKTSLGMTAALLLFGSCRPHTVRVYAYEGAFLSGQYCLPRIHISGHRFVVPPRIARQWEAAARRPILYNEQDDYQNCKRTILPTTPSYEITCTLEELPQLAESVVEILKRDGEFAATNAQRRSIQLPHGLGVDSPYMWSTTAWRRHNELKNFIENYYAARVPSMARATA